MTPGLPPVADRRRALTERVGPWAPLRLDERLDWAAAATPDRPLVITDEVTWTYREVVERSHHLADGLAALGAGDGSRVAIVMANHPDFVPLKFAVARTGAVAVPLNFLYRAGELAYVLRQSRCDLLVTMTAYGALDHQALLDEIAPGWAGGPTPALPELRHVVVHEVEGRPSRGAMTLEDLAELGRRHPAAAHTATRPEDLGDILYTSGTTGSPKGVMITHDAPQRTGYASALTRAMEDGRRILFSLPCYHMFGYVEGLMAALFVGGAVVLQPAFDPLGYFGGIERHRATDILAVPTMTVALVEHPRRTEFDLSSVFALLSGAAPAPVWLWEQARDRLGITEIVTGYGMTEAGGAMTLSLPEDPFEVVSTTVGRVKLAGTAGLAGRHGDLCEYRTCDPVDGTLLPPGAEGELVARGPTIMLGFWEKPEETARAMTADGWLRSGDLGRVLDRGHGDYLQLTGRSKELYKTGGELVAPKEIEELLSRHPGVSQVYVVGVPDERWGEAGCAWVVPEPGTSLDPGELIELCRARLARFKVPKAVLLTTADELPTTPTGKVQKFRLVEAAAARLAATGDATAGAPDRGTVS
jgi:fatty-acyl-CoA synthase